MKKFRYRALDNRGSVVSGRIEATGERGAAKQLQDRGLKPFELEAIKPTGTSLREGGILGSIRAPMSRRQLLLFTRQMATLLDAGVPLLRSVQTLRSQMDSGSARSLLHRIEKDLRGGFSFSEALGEHPRVFDRVYVQVVKAGETAGRLGSVLMRLADFEQRREEVRTRVMTAVLYPVSVGGFSLLIALFLVVGVLPVFARMYREMNAALPMPTRVLMGVRLVLVHRWPWMLAGLAGSGAAVGALAGSDWGRRRLDEVKLSLPVLGPLYRTAMTVRFARILGTLVETGVPILDALEIVEGTVGNRRAGQLLKRVRRRVSEGRSIYEPLKQSELFSPMVVQMISVGEQSGQLDEMLSRIAETCEFRLESSVERVSSVLQPALLVLLGLVVGACVISMFLPMLNMVKVIGIR